MKRLTIRFCGWLEHRARREAKRRQVSRTKASSRARLGEPRFADAWTGTETVRVRLDQVPWSPPEILCFRKNPLGTLSYFDELRRRSRAIDPAAEISKGGWIITGPGKRRKPRIITYADYSKIKEISTAAAIVIAADYERLAVLVGSAPPTINLHSWSDPIFRKLFELGFFEIVGLTAQVSDRYRDDGQRRTMQIVSGTDADHEYVVTELFELSKHLLGGRSPPEEVILALNSALSEAMANVVKHAYKGRALPFRHIGKWWVTAEADRVANRLTVVIYDHGATIPVTLPERAHKDHLASYFRRIVGLVMRDQGHDFIDDSAYISYAMEEGTTQTGQSNRGYGIPQMMELIDICGAGRLTIFSRGGCCEYTPGGNKEISRDTYPLSIGGTLIEWVIEFPEGLGHDLG